MPRMWFPCDSPETFQLPFCGFPTNTEGTCFLFVSVFLPSIIYVYKFLAVPTVIFSLFFLTHPTPETPRQYSSSFSSASVFQFHSVQFSSRRYL